MLTRSPCHTLYLGPQGVLAFGPDSVHGNAATPVACDDATHWCRTHAGRSARLVLGGRLLRSLVIDPALRLTDATALRAHAQQQFVLYHGEAARHWPIAVWSTASAAGACAVPGLDLTALRATAAAHRVRLRGMVPAWSCGLRSLAAVSPELRETGRHAVALVEGTCLTWLVVTDDGSVTELQHRLLPGASADALQDGLARFTDESSPLHTPPLVVGWGIADAERLPLRHAGRIAAPGHHGAMAAWLHDRVVATSQ